MAQTKPLMMLRLLMTILGHKRDIIMDYAYKNTYFEVRVNADATGYQVYNTETNVDESSSLGSESANYAKCIMYVEQAASIINAVLGVPEVDLSTAKTFQH